MAESTIWWLLAGGMVAIELATGTFYLLMISIGFVAAAMAAHLGVAVPLQIIAAAAIGGGAVTAWHWFKGKGPQSAPVNANRDVHIDIGEPVRVEEWNEDGTATVKYRGANWTAVCLHADAELQMPGLFRIKELLGNRLVIEKI